MRTIRWRMVGDSSAEAVHDIGHPHKPRAVAWLSVTEPGLMGGCMAAVTRVLEAYGTVLPDVRGRIPAPADSGAATTEVQDEA